MSATRLAGRIAPLDLALYLPRLRFGELADVVQRGRAARAEERRLAARHDSDGGSAWHKLPSSEWLAFEVARTWEWSCAAPGYVASLACLVRALVAWGDARGSNYGYDSEAEARLDAAVQAEADAYAAEVAP